MSGHHISFFKGTWFHLLNLDVAVWNIPYENMLHNLKYSSNLEKKTFICLVICKLRKWLTFAIT